MFYKTANMIFKSYKTLLLYLSLYKDFLEGDSYPTIRSLEQILLVENSGKCLKVEWFLQEELQLSSPLSSGEPDDRSSSHAILE